MKFMSIWLSNINERLFENGECNLRWEIKNRINVQRQQHVKSDDI